MEWQEKYSGSNASSMSRAYGSMHSGEAHTINNFKRPTHHYSDKNSPNGKL